MLDDVRWRERVDLGAGERAPLTPHVVHAGCAGCDDVVGRVADIERTGSLDAEAFSREQNIAKTKASATTGQSLVSFSFPGSASGAAAPGAAAGQDEDLYG